MKLFFPQFSQKKDPRMKKRKKQLKRRRGGKKRKRKGISIRPHAGRMMMKETIRIRRSNQRTRHDKDIRKQKIKEI